MSFRKSVHYGHTWPDRCVLGLFTLAIHDQIGSGIYCLFRGLFTLHCGHNTQVTLMKNTLYLLKFILSMKLKLGSSYYLTLRRLVYMLISNVSTWTLKLSFFNWFYIFFSILLLFYFVYSLFLIKIVLFRFKKLSFIIKNNKLSWSIEYLGTMLLEPRV